jgi:hypothetical protein
MGGLYFERNLVPEQFEKYYHYLVNYGNSESFFDAIDQICINLFQAAFLSDFNVDTRLSIFFKVKCLFDFVYTRAGISLMIPVTLS